MGEVVPVVEVGDADGELVHEERLPVAYLPLEQTQLWSPSVQISLRSDAGPSAITPAITRAIEEVHPAVTLEFATLTEQVAVSLARPRLLAALSGFFGALALLLAVIGLYGTMSYNVARRRNEMGVRIALGAGRGRIVRLVAAEAWTVVALGAAVGVALALGATRLIGAFLYGVGSSDPRTLVLSTLLLAAVAMGAALIPAWRAGGVDPMDALREE